MDAMTLRVLRRLESAIEAIDNAVIVAAEAYANGGYRGAPIVDRHFTPGNQQRYGWPDLSPAYAERKRLAKGALRKIQRAAGRKVSQYDEDNLGGAILPMLVATGALRAAVTARGHRMERVGDTVFVVFDNLPQYALYLHSGTPKMPKRSPVEPNLEDQEAVQAEVQKYLDKVLGTGGDFDEVPVSSTSIPGRARVVTPLDQ